MRPGTLRSRLEAGRRPIRPDRYDPLFNRTFEDYAQHRGFVIDPAPVRQATGKPHGERQVPYVRENFFRGEDFLSRDQSARLPPQPACVIASRGRLC